MSCITCELVFFRNLLSTNAKTRYLLGELKEKKTIVVTLPSSVHIVFFSFQSCSFTFYTNTHARPILKFWTDEYLRLQYVKIGLEFSEWKQRSQANSL